jgi:hypothetical protein
VGDGVLCVDIGGDARVSEKVSGGILLGSLRFVEDDRHGPVPLVGVAAGLCDRRGREE